MTKRAGKFYEGLAVHCRGKYADNDCGHIDTQGNFLKGSRYRKMKHFSEGLAPVAFGRGKWGYINKKGKMVIKYSYRGYKKAEPFSEGKAVVTLNERRNRVRFINKKGEFVLGEYEEASSFSEGVAAVYRVSPEGWALIDHDGKVLVELKAGGRAYISDVGESIKGFIPLRYGNYCITCDEESVTFGYIRNPLYKN